MTSLIATRGIDPVAGVSSSRYLTNVLLCCLICCSLLVLEQLARWHHSLHEKKKIAEHLGAMGLG